MEGLFIMLRLSMAGAYLPGRWLPVGLVVVLSLLAGRTDGRLRAASPVEDDTNAQHLAIVEDKLKGDSREIALPVETGSMRLEVILESGDGLRMTVTNPSGSTVNLEEPNVVVAASTGRSSILIWDPRPGTWRVKIEGQGQYRLRAITQGDLFVCCAQILTINQVFALERSRLVPGTRHQVQVFASGYTIDTIDVQMVDQRGIVIAPVRFRQNDPSNISGFVLLLEVPDRPFRLNVEGKDLSGKPFRRVIPPVFVPASGADGPGGAEERPGEQLPSNPRTIEELGQSTTPGPRQIIRTHISSWSDEPFLTAKGNQIGIRLRFQATFPTDASYTPYPTLYPDRIGQGYTGALNLRVHQSSVSPQPPELNGVPWTFNTRAKFGAGIKYEFLIDLVPGYALPVGTEGRLCLNYRQFAQPDLLSRFEKEISSRRRTRFRFGVSGSDFEGKMNALTDQTYVPETWLEGLRREGAVECKF